MGTKMAAISGTPQPKQPTSNSAAWLGGNYRTMKLVADVDAVRVSVGVAVGVHADRGGAALDALGRWFAVGDVVLTRSAYTTPRQPAGFSRVDWCVLRAGSIVNVGRCSPMFGHAGGGDQVEWVSGPRPESVTTDE